jgi:hypothetical protein
MCDHEPDAVAWDCDPTFLPIYEGVELDLDEEDDEGDWQVLCLDRFGDRLVTASLFDRQYLPDINDTFHELADELDSERY